MARYAYSREDQGDLNTSTVQSARNKKFIDIDLNFTAKSTSGDIFKKTDQAAVKQSIKNLLMTNKLEKPFHEKFGADITGMLFELADDRASVTIRRNIVSNLKRYEPRAKIMDINVISNPDAYTLRVRLTFRVMTTGEIIDLETTISRLR